MGKRRSIFYGALMLTAANLGLRTVSMGFQVYISNRIGAAGMGLLQLVMNVGMLAVTVGSSGVRVAATYLVAEEYGHRRPGGMRRAVEVCMAYGLIVSVAAGAVLYQLSDWLAVQWILDARAAAPLRVLAISVPVSCLVSILSGYFTACSKIGRLVAVDLLERVASIFLTVAALLLWAGDDTERACCAILGGSAAASVVSLALLLGLFAWDCRSLGRPPSGLHMGKRLLKLCLPLAVNDYLRTGLNTADQLLIPRGLAQADSSYEQSMAAYGTIHGMVFPILMFPSAVLYSISDLLVPELARCRAAGWRQRIYNLTDHCIRMGLLFSACVAGLLFLLADQLGQLFYGSADAGMYLRLFAPLVLMLYMDAIVDGMHKGLGQQVACMRYNTFTSALELLLLVLLLPRYGIGGYFAAFTITHAVNFYLSIARLIKITDYAPTLRFVCKTAASAAGATGLTYLFSGFLATLSPLLEIFCLAAVFLVLFAAFCALLTVLSREDLRWLKGILRPV